MYNAYFAFLNALCSEYLTRHQSRSPEAFTGQGAAIPESQIIMALCGEAEAAPAGDLAQYFQDLMAQADDRLTKLWNRLEATVFQRLVMLLALAPRIHRKYERVFAYMQDSTKPLRGGER